MTNSKSLTEIVRICFKKCALLDIVQNKYITSDVYLQLIKMNYGHLDVIKGLSANSFKKSLSQMPTKSRFEQNNITKYFIKESKRLKNGLGSYQRFIVCYICNPGSLPVRTNVPWYADTSNLIMQMPRSWTTRLNQHLITTTDARLVVDLSADTEMGETDTEDPSDPASKRQRLIPPSPQLNPIEEEIKNYTYWNSGKASSTFGYFDPKDNGQKLKPIEEIVTERMMRMREGYKAFNGWKHNIEDGDELNVCTHFDIFLLQLKCKYISISLKIALEELHKSDMTWEKCCRLAIQRINELEVNDDDEKGNNNVIYYRHTNSIICFWTIQRWHLDFPRNDESFKNLTAGNTKNRTLKKLCLRK